MTGKEGHRGVVLVCDMEGGVREVLRDDLGVADGAERFGDLLQRGSREKGGRFLERLRDQGQAVGWELLVETDPPRELFFAGGRTDAHLLVIGAASERSAMSLYQEMMSISNEQANLVRQAAEEARDARRQIERMSEGGAAGEPRTAVEGGDLDPVSELSRVNNELTNLQRELARKNAELQRLSAQKDRFLGMAAHDLRNPLGVILGYADFLQGEMGPELDDRQRRFLEAIESQANFMIQLVEELLDISTIESGEVVLEREEVEVAELVRRNVELNRALAEEKGVAVEADTDDGELRARVDPSKVEQILNNLVTNAVKFSDPGSTVTVRARRDGGELLLEVEDRGQGIPEDERERLFVPFGRTSVKATAGEGSTGLGLAITKRLVDAHGGRIDVESEVGVGSTFRVRLPPEPPGGDEG